MDPVVKLIFRWYIIYIIKAKIITTTLVLKVCCLSFLGFPFIFFLMFIAIPYLFPY